MELQQINQRIAVVNGESKRMNNERQVLIGRRQTLEKQLSDALAAYQKEYGVTLTVENIAAEIARVSALKEAEVSGIETMLSLIKAGMYDEAEKLANEQVKATSDEQTEVPVEMPAQPMQMSQPMQESQPVQEAQPTPVTPPVFSKPAEPVGVPPMEPPVFAPPPVQTAQPVQPSQPVQPGTPAGVVPQSEDAPPAPPPPLGKPKARQPLGTPKIGVPPAVGATQPGTMSFQAILDGKAFNPQGVNQ